MVGRFARGAVAAAVLIFLPACGVRGVPNEVGGVGWGPDPELPAPKSSLFPVVNTARPVGWSERETPVAPAGFVVTRYAALDHPRRVYVLSNGDVLVAQSATLSERGGGPIGWIRNQVQRGAGAVVESPNRITLLRDSDSDGDVDQTNVFLENLNQPFGMAQVGGQFFVGNTDAVMRFRHQVGQTQIESEGEVLAPLPYNAASNGHWTRDLLASPDGSKLYVGVGSVSNIPKNADAFRLEEGRAAIWEIDLSNGERRIFASGLRNPNGLAWEPQTGALWVAVNERDELGDDLVPDYMTSVNDGAFYGWPYSYFGQNVDVRVRPQRPARVATAVAPDYALGPHTASLGLTFYTAEGFPERYRGGAFVAQHGSWNRSAPSGYQVVFVPFENGRHSGRAEAFLTGFLNPRNHARGRPVSVAVDRTGALLVADDVGNAVWRVAKLGD